jgi:hypothetical protein
LTGQEAAATVASAFVKRIVAWVGGAAGTVAAYRSLVRRRARPVPGGAPVPDPRAAELRTRIEAGRGAVAEPEDAPAPAETPEPVERRRAVHEEGRAALDEMRGAGS